MCWWLKEGGPKVETDIRYNVWECSSGVEHLTNTLKALSSSLSTTNKTKWKQRQVWRPSQKRGMAKKEKSVLEHETGRFWTGPPCWELSPPILHHRQDGEACLACWYVLGAPGSFLNTHCACCLLHMDPHAWSAQLCRCQPRPAITPGVSQRPPSLFVVHSFRTESDPWPSPGFCYC